MHQLPTCYKLVVGTMSYHNFRLRVDVERRRWNGVVLAVVVVVVAVKVVAVSVVVHAIHDNQPFFLNPYPRMERTHTPQRNGRTRPVVRMVGDMVAANTVRGRMVVRRRTGVIMPCDRRVVDMTGGRLVSRRAWLGGGSCSRRGARGLRGACGLRGARGLRSSRRPRRAWSGCRARGLRSSCGLRRSRLTRHARRASSSARFTAMAASLGRSECHRANGRAGDSDDCEFHEVVIVVVHSAPSLSALEFADKPISSLHCVR